MLLYTSSGDRVRYTAADLDFLGPNERDAHEDALERLRGIVQDRGISYAVVSSCISNEERKKAREVLHSHAGLLYALERSKQPRNCRVEQDSAETPILKVEEYPKEYVNLFPQNGQPFCNPTEAIMHYHLQLQDEPVYMSYVKQLGYRPNHTWEMAYEFLIKYLLSIEISTSVKLRKAIVRFLKPRRPFRCNAKTVHRLLVKIEEQAVAYSTRNFLERYNSNYIDPSQCSYWCCYANSVMHSVLDQISPTSSQPMYLPNILTAAVLENHLGAAPGPCPRSMLLLCKRQRREPTTLSELQEVVRDWDSEYVKDLDVLLKVTEGVDCLATGVQERSDWYAKTAAALAGVIDLVRPIDQYPMYVADRLVCAKFEHCLSLAPYAYPNTKLMQRLQRQELTTVSELYRAVEEWMAELGQSYYEESAPVKNGTVISYFDLGGRVGGCRYRRHPTSKEPKVHNTAIVST